MKKSTPMVQNNTLIIKDSHDSGEFVIEVGSNAWYKWLENNDGFIYRGDTGHFTARVEFRRGIGYWYAYRRRDGKLSKIYLGKIQNLTLNQLKQASVSLAGQISIKQLLSKSITESHSIIPEIPDQPHKNDQENQYEILALPLTKIITHDLPINHIPRPHLTRRISNPVVTLFAPAGFGKSTLLHEWRKSCGIPVAWVTLDFEDNNPQRFWSMVIASFQTMYPNLGRTGLTMLYTSAPADLPKFVINLSNDIVRIMLESDTTKGIGLVLDNYHHIQNPVVHASVQVLVDHIPPKMKLVIASQASIPLEFGRLRSKGHVQELGVEDLRFSLEEGIGFLAQHSPAKTLAYRDLEKLVKRTKGWISGLVLAITLLAKEKDPSRFVEFFNGAHPYIREFFAENVLNQLSPDMQNFLLKTSILEQLYGPLCDAITGSNGSDELLAELWHNRLFLEAQEEIGQYRYDDLFCDSLRFQLEEQYPSDLSELHRKAANWYAANKNPTRTIHHLLCCKAWEEAVELIEKVALQDLEKSGEGSRLLRWLQQIPESVLFQHQMLLILYIRLAMLFSPPLVVEQLLTRTEVLFGSSLLSDVNTISQISLSEIHKLHHFWLTNEKIKPSLFQDQNTNSIFQMMDQILVFRRDYRNDLVLAEKKATVVYENALTKGHLFTILFAGGSCADLAFSQGHLRQSEMIAHQVLQQALKIYGKLPEPASNVLTTLSGVYYERNQIDQAHRLLVRADEINQNLTSTGALKIAILRAKIQSTLGDNDAAFTTIQAASEMDALDAFSAWTDRDLIAYKALFLLQKGELISAQRLLSEFAPSSLQGFPAMVHAAILMEQSRYLVAEEILTELLQKYPYGFYWLPILRAQVMLSLALFNQHKINQSSLLMAEAARIAAPEFFIRPFLVSGEKIVSLLSLVLHTENLNIGTRSFIKGILTTLGYGKGATDIIPKEEFASLEIAVSITPREQQILRLLNANLSNQEIADQCSISSSTVKTHLENIYRKLGVENRAQAISEARMLNLV